MSDPSSSPQVTEATLEEMLNSRLSVDAVTVQGASRTSPKLLDKLTNPVLSTGGTFSGVIDDISLAIERLRSTNCFRGIDAYVDRSSSSTQDASVTFTVNEKPFYQLRTGTMIETSGEKEGSLEGAFLWRNCSGRADTLTAAVNWGAGKMFGKEPSISWDIAYRDPFLAGVSTALFAKLGGGVRNYLDPSGYMLRDQSGEIGFDFGSLQLSVGSAWREIGNVEKDCGVLLREMAGHSWKTFAKIAVETDGRDSSAMPTVGTRLGGFVEAAVPKLGDVGFVKGEVNAQGHAPLGASGLSVGLSASAGALIGQAGVADRFFVGGNSMRGFKPRGLGPRDSGKSVGGGGFYVMTGMISIGVPEGSLLHQLFDARVHAFGSVGDLVEGGVVEKGFKELGKSGANAKEKLTNGWNSMRDGMRAVVGVGVALQTAVGRVEINFCQVAKAAEGDKKRVGLQVAISDSFS